MLNQTKPSPSKKLKCNFYFFFSFVKKNMRIWWTTLATHNIHNIHSSRINTRAVRSTHKTKFKIYTWAHLIYRNNLLLRRRRRRRLLLLQSPWHCKHIILVSAAIAFDWAETGLHCWPVMELQRLRGANILYSSRHILHRGEEDISRWRNVGEDSEWVRKGLIKLHLLSIS